MSNPPASTLGRALRRACPLVVAALSVGGCPAPKAQPRPPDVLVIVLDAVRADRLGFDGYSRPTSPRLDELARESIHFENAYSAATWTKPSVASLFTSRYPSEHGLLDLDFSKGGGLAALDASLPVIAESFKAGGWSTVAVINQVHLVAKNGFGRGFDQYRQMRGKAAPAINRRFGVALDEVGEKPFFAYVHYLDAHWPYDPVPRKLVATLGEGRLPVEPPNDLEASRDWQTKYLDAAAIAALSSRYDAEIHELDRNLGELFEMLRKRGRWENTIVVVTADHGESFAERGLLQHGHEPYVDQSRIPLLIRVPARFGFPPGARTTPVGHVDLAPTLLDLAGAPPLPGARGRLLRELLGGKENGAELALTQAELSWALRDARHTYLVFTNGRTERFDRSVDPLERTSLTPEACGEPCEALASRLRRFKAELRLAVKIVPTRELTAEEKKELEALGYL